MKGKNKTMKRKHGFQKPKIVEQKKEEESEEPDDTEDVSTFGPLVI